MSRHYGSFVGSPIEFEGSNPQDQENREVCFPSTFGRVARAIWPNKTALHLARIGSVSDRAAKDWLSGKVAPPATVVTAMLVEITKRD